MISKCFSLFWSLILLTCNRNADSKEVANAKWYFYAFALEEKGWSQNGKEVDPLTYDIKLKGIRQVNKDTVRYYFALYQGDTLNVCNLMPYGLVGVNVIRDEVYIPIYHYGMFHEKPDWIMRRMKKQKELLLQRAWKENHINDWLKDEVLKRG